MSEQKDPLPTGTTKAIRAEPHKYETPFKSLCCTVAAGKDLTKTSSSDTWSPSVRVTLGEKILVGEPKWHEKGTSPKFGTMYNFPFEGEPVVRLEVTDHKHREAGFHDYNLINLVKNKDKGTAFVDLPVGGVKGPAGQLTAKLEFSEKAIAKPSVVKMAEDDSVKSALKSASNYKSLIVYLIYAKDLYDPNSWGKLDPYFKVQLGKSSIQGEVLSNKGTNPEINQCYSFVFNGEDNATIYVRESESMKKDRDIGHGSFDLQPLKIAADGGQVIPIDIITPDGKMGSAKVYAYVTFLEFPVTSDGCWTPKFKKSKALGEDYDAFIKTSHPDASKYDAVRLWVYNGEGLYDPEKIGKMDPYLNVRCGWNIEQNPAKSGGGKNVSINRHFLMHYDRWKNIRVILMDEQTGHDRETGAFDINMEDVLRSGQKMSDIKVDVKAIKEGHNGGFMNVRVELIEKLDKWMCQEDFDYKKHPWGEHQNSSTAPPPVVHSVKERSGAPQATDFQTCILWVMRCDDLLDPEKVGKMDPYFKIKLGGKEQATQYISSAGSTTNINQGMRFPYKGEHSVEITAMDKQSVKKDRVVGEGSMPLDAITCQENGGQKVVVPLKKGQEQAGTVTIYQTYVTHKHDGKAETFKPFYESTDIVSSPDGWEVEKSAHPNAAKYEGVNLYYFNAKDIYSPQKVGKQDPFIYTAMGWHHEKGKTYSDGSHNPVFNEVHRAHYDRYKRARVVIYDDEPGGKSSYREGSAAYIDFDEMLSKNKKVSDIRVPLTAAKSEHTSGELFVRVEFIEKLDRWMSCENFDPAAVGVWGTYVDEQKSAPPPTPGAQSVGVQARSGAPQDTPYKTCLLYFVRCDNLSDPQYVGKMDPYCKVRISNKEERFDEVRDGGPSVPIHRCVQLPYTGEHVAEITVWDRERLKKDRQIGTGSLPLDAVGHMTNGSSVVNVPIKDMKGGDGGTVTIQQVFLKAANEAGHWTPFYRHTGILPAEDGWNVKEKTTIEEAKKYEAIKLYFFNATDLYDPQTIGKMDPFLLVSCGWNHEKSKTFKNAGKSPTFNQVFYCHYDRYKRTRFIIYDDQVGAKNFRECGAQFIDLEPILAIGQQKADIKVDVKAVKDKHAGGFAYVRVEFVEKFDKWVSVEDFEPTSVGVWGTYPLGSKASTDGTRSAPEAFATPEAFSGAEAIQNTTYKTAIFHIMKANNLHDPQRVGKMDPYWKIRIGAQEVEGEACRDGGANANPVNHVLQIPYAGQSTATVVVADRERVGKNRDVGYGEFKIDCASFDANGGKMMTVPLKGPDGNSDGGNFEMYASLLNFPVDSTNFWKSAHKTSELLPPTTGYEKTSNASAAKYEAVKVMVFDGQGLYDPEMIGKMDPFVNVRSGWCAEESKAINGGGKDVAFNWQTTMHYDRYEKLQLIVFDDQTGKKRHREVGAQYIEMTPILESGQKVVDVKLDTKAPKQGHSGGDVYVRVEMIEIMTEWVSSGKFDRATTPAWGTFALGQAPALSGYAATDFNPNHEELTKLTHNYKTLKVFITKGRGLYDPDTGKMDPYLMCWNGNKELKGEVFKDAGSDPDFNTMFVYPWQSHRYVHLQIKDKERIGKDKSSGSCWLDLDKYLPLGVDKKHEDKVPVTASKEGKSGGHLDLWVMFETKEPDSPVPYVGTFKA
eukprot:GHVP01028280.1.p1 GENE.GHVP01028280.1~~GHVP01028280.1.p1  ORF type:complete len:1656 (+),score=323.61 GHVP01028280.1:36-5003(+)